MQDLSLEHSCTASPVPGVPSVGNTMDDLVTGHILYTFKKRGIIVNSCRDDKYLYFYREERGGSLLSASSSLPPMENRQPLFCQSILPQSSALL